MRNMVIAIDGTSASGKGFISKSISELLGFSTLDTGSLYRACTLRILERFFYEDILSNFKKIEFELLQTDIEKFFSKVPQSDFIDEITIFRDSGNLYEYTKNPLIRSQLVSVCVPIIAKIPEIRLLMHDYQVNFAKNSTCNTELSKINNVCGCIVEGRDIGTNIFPNADLKLFITASVEIRAMRRFKDYELDPNNKITYDEVLNALRLRDEQDMNRSFRPLKPADDAVIIDTTDMSKEQVLKYIKQIIQDKLRISIN